MRPTIATSMYKYVRGIIQGEWSISLSLGTFLRSTEILAT